MARKRKKTKEPLAWRGEEKEKPAHEAGEEKKIKGATAERRAKKTKEPLAWREKGRKQESRSRGEKKGENKRAARVAGESKKNYERTIGPRR